MNLGTDGATNVRRFERRDATDRFAAHHQLRQKRPRVERASVASAEMGVLFEVGYRVVAVACCCSCGSAAWYSFVERKISLFNTDLFDFWTPREKVFHRDVAPFRYWMFTSMEVGSTILCLIAAIAGWQPNN